jgi:non-heme chloroperoxidase
MVHFANVTQAPLLSSADAQLTSGIRLRYAFQGPQFGPAIVLLHGYSDSALSFGRVLPLLPPDLRVVAPDLRGHGDSARPPAGYRITDLADDVLQLMDALQIPRAVVVGHSMGSFVAQAIAERSPQQVASLVLVGSAPSAANSAVAELSAVVQAMEDPVDAEFVSAFQRGSVVLPVPEAFMAAAIANSLRMPAAVWKQVLAGLIEYRPASVRPAIRTLVLGGTQDTVFSVDEQTRLARQYPNGRLQLLNNVGHTPHWEVPHAFVDALLRFVK